MPIATVNNTQVYYEIHGEGEPAVCMGLERVNPQVYLLTPTGVEVPVEEKLRIRDEGLGDHH